jgi:hypothetical protein
MHVYFGFPVVPRKVPIHTNFSLLRAQATGQGPPSTCGFLALAAVVESTSVSSGVVLLR